MSPVSHSASGAEALDLSTGNLTLVAVVGVIALVALAMAMVFRGQVLAAGEGTVNMKAIAQAVQEGASAYLTRMFRTLAIFAVLAFAILFVLPADDGSSKRPSRASRPPSWAQRGTSAATRLVPEADQGY